MVKKVKDAEVAPEVSPNEDVQISSPQPSVAPPSKSFKPMLLIIGLVIVIGLLSTYSVLSSRQTQPSSPPVPQTRTTPPANPTAGWKTYSYPNFGYSFKLPSNYRVNENRPNPTSPKTVQSLSLNESDVSMGPNDLGIFVVNSSLEERLTEMEKDNIVSQGKTKSVNGFEWTIATSSRGETQYLLSYGGKVYVLGGRNVKFLDQVLSTFKFTDANQPSPSQPASKINNTYTVPQGWQKYADTEAGIAIYYPPQYIAKYNSNRGAGVNYRAGSYLLGSNGETILDFFKFRYDGGSRREAFYNNLEDQPEASKYTISATDITLNGRAYLKLVSNYWAKFENGVNRVFFLSSLGNQMYYFTYSSSLENNSTDYKNILTIIATSTLSTGSGTDSRQYAECYPARPSSGNINDSWEAYIENGDMIVIQRTNKLLKQQDINQTRVSISGNTQNRSSGISQYFTITDFDIYVDSSKKGNYQDAFVIKIKRTDVDRIAQETPSSIPSVAIAVSISGGVETTDGKKCHADLLGYYAPKP